MLGAPQTWGGGRRRSFLVTKKRNTLLGRTYIFVGNNDVTDAVRRNARSAAKEIGVSGCQAISRTAATGTPGVIAAYTLSCWYARHTFHKTISSPRSPPWGGWVYCTFLFPFRRCYSRKCLPRCGPCSYHSRYKYNSALRQQKNIRYSCLMRSHSCERLNSAVNTLAPPCLPLPQLIPCCSCGACLRNEPEMCPLFRKAIITAPTEWSREEYTRRRRRKR